MKGGAPQRLTWGGHTDRYTAQERQAHMKEKDKEGANGEEEKEDRHRVNHRMTQKTQVAAIRRQRGQPSEKEDGQVHGSMEIPRYLKYGILDTELEVERRAETPKYAPANTDRA